MDDFKTFLNMRDDARGETVERQDVKILYFNPRPVRLDMAKLFLQFERFPLQTVESLSQLSEAALQAGSGVLLVTHTPEAAELRSFAGQLTEAPVKLPTLCICSRTERQALADVGYQFQYLTWPLSGTALRTAVLNAYDVSVAHLT